MRCHAAAALILAGACGSSAAGPSDLATMPVTDGSAADAAVPMTTLAYSPSSGEDLPNPERGFFDQVDLVAGGDFSFVRTEGFTLAYAPVRLDAYVASALPQTLLDSLGAGFGDVRSAGIKVILRLVYNDAANGADAPLAQIQQHLTQLAPVLSANADVIAVMEAGLIGAWGEWHDSTNGLDNPTDRLAVLGAILAALPASRATLVRTPMFKSDAYGGPLKAAQAFDGSPASRVGHHNDCFLASADDEGTYVAPIDTWKAFVAEEGRFVPVGGETCGVDPPRSDCPSALSEMATLHWSFLNSLYEPNVLAAWSAQGCRGQIAAALGYRFELESATFESAVAPGGVLDLTVTLRNLGNAAPFNARPVYVTLDDAGTVLAAPLDPAAVDPRRWEPGAPITIAARLRIPAGVAPGAHALGLWLPDADPGLRAAAAYSVRIPNATWVAPYNVLTSAFVIDPAAPGPVDPGATDFTALP